MAKFIKSIFHTTERRKPKHEELEEDKNNFTPPLGDRRKLSISRSGRMRQANKKRLSLSLELYNQGLDINEKRNSMDFNTHKQITIDSKTQEKNPRTQTTEPVTPEEEIDNAFAIIDKA